MSSVIGDSGCELGVDYLQQDAKPGCVWGFFCLSKEQSHAKPRKRPDATRAPRVWRLSRLDGAALHLATRSREQASIRCCPVFSHYVRAQQLRISTTTISSISYPSHHPLHTRRESSLYFFHEQLLEEPLNINHALHPASMANSFCWYGQSAFPGPTRCVCQSPHLLDY